MSLKLYILATYVATKAALLAYSNTLRIELAPFKYDARNTSRFDLNRLLRKPFMCRVQVISVTTGSVKSNVARSRPLPENSLYLPCKDAFAIRSQSGQQNTIPTDEYAAIVVGQLVEPKPKRWIWAGAIIWWVWFYHYFWPNSVW